MARSSSAVKGSSSSRTEGWCRKALAHAAGKLAHQAVFYALEARAFQPFHGGLLGIGQIVEPPEQAQIFESGQLVVDGDAVPDPSHAAARLGIARIVAEDADLSAPGFGKAADDAQQGGFPRSIAADQGQARTGFGVQNHVAQRGIVAVELPDALSGDRAHSFLSRSDWGNCCRFPSCRGLSDANLTPVPLKQQYI
jgi:hypothetical protein